jgi:hypothetical protein
MTMMLAKKINPARLPHQAGVFHIPRHSNVAPTIEIGKPIYQLPKTKQRAAAITKIALKSQGEKAIEVAIVTPSLSL